MAQATEAFDPGVLRARTYRFSSDGESFEADNRAQNFRARWDKSGVSIELKGGSHSSVGMRFSRWGAPARSPS